MSNILEGFHFKVTICFGAFCSWNLTRNCCQLPDELDYRQINIIFDIMKQLLTVYLVFFDCNCNYMDSFQFFRTNSVNVKFQLNHVLFVNYETFFLLLQYVQDLFETEILDNYYYNIVLTFAYMLYLLQILCLCYLISINASKIKHFCLLTLPELMFSPLLGSIPHICQCCQSECTLLLHKFFKVSIVIVIVCYCSFYFIVLHNFYSSRRSYFSSTCHTLVMCWVKH